jgi:hypothetical protein
MRREKQQAVREIKAIKMLGRPCEREVKGRALAANRSWQAGRQAVHERHDWVHCLVYPTSSRVGLSQTVSPQPTH